MYRSARKSRTSELIPWNWLVAIVTVTLVLITIKWLFWWGDEENGSYILITPRNESVVYISMSQASKNRIEWPSKLFATDKSVAVENWSAYWENDFVKLDLDKNTELTYKSHSWTGEILGMSKGRLWISAKNIPVLIELKHLSVLLDSGETAMVEQNNAYSIAYSIEWSIAISTKNNDSYQLAGGNRVMIGASDLINGTTDYPNLSGPIDESIMQNDIFKRNGGDVLLWKLSISSSGMTILTGGTLHTSTWNTNHVIEITDPVDGSVSKSNTVTVIGKILSKEVKRVTINDKDASVSPVNESFILQNIPVEKDILNLVYKAYDSNNSLMEKWVVVVFWSKWAKDSQGRLESNSFPISNKDFKIVFPSENPYKTTDSLVKVQWSVPKDTVEYIVVNDYRLQKFIPGSTTWYYYANTETKSMVDGINLYTINFYSSDNSLLYSQLFTIVKEPKNANVSGEIIR